MCDKCPDKFVLVDNECISTECQTGWEFNFETNLCEDKVCKVDSCKNCETFGIELCNECESEFILSEDFKKCNPDLSCKVSGCGTCEQRETCDKCEDGLWLTEVN